MAKGVSCRFVEESKIDIVDGDDRVRPIDAGEAVRKGRNDGESKVVESERRIAFSSSLTSWVTGCIRGVLAGLSNSAGQRPGPQHVGEEISSFGTKSVQDCGKDSALKG